MGTLAKVLLVINLLASAGFLYLATQDWAQGRQRIEAAGLRHLILLNGLPVGEPNDTPDLPADPSAEVPFDLLLPSGRPVGTVSPGLLKAYFGGAGPATTENAALVLTTNAPVRSQIAEVKRVRGEVEKAVNAADGPRAKAAVVAPLLRLQAETLDERNEVLALAARGAGDQLWDLLRAKFDRVVTAARPLAADRLGGPEDPPADRLKKVAEARAEAVKDAPEREARLAHLLAHLDPDPGWQKRVLLVVGVRRYVAAIGAQAARFGQMAGRVERLTADDQARFAAEYAQLRDLAIQRTQTVRDTAEVRERLRIQAQKDQDFVTQRQTQIRELADQLARVKAEVDALLARQKVVEEELLALQREVARTQDEVYKLEGLLTEAEQRRYGAAGK